MPKRSNTIRLDASAVQGEGAFVEFQRFTWGEEKALRREAQETQDDEARINLTAQAIVAHLKAWNWVYSDDSPIPLPKTANDLDTLLDAEMAFLADGLTRLLNLPEQAEAKNS